MLWLRRRGRAGADSTGIIFPAPSGNFQGIIGRNHLTIHTGIVTKNLEFVLLHLPFTVSNSLFLEKHPYEAILQIENEIFC